MKVSHIIVESKKQTTNEAPVSGFKQGLTKLAAKGLAKVGAKDTALGLAGKADTGDEANKLRGEFQNYMGTTGQSMSKIDAGELSAWLKSKKYPTDAVPAQGVLNKKELDQILLKSVQANKRVSSGAGATAEPAGGASANAKQGTTNTGAVDKATATGSSTAPDGKAPPTQNGSAGGPATEIPPNIQAQLDLLNDPDKKRLAALL
jgi:hypothetical protein